MSNARRLEDILNAAQAHEKSYAWLEAAKLYAQAVGVVGQKDFLLKGEIQERIGYCCRRAAMQAESQEAFKERMQRAVDAYKNAGGLYESLVDAQKAARKLRCLAVVKYLGHWLTSDPAEKRRLLDDCLALEAKALRSFGASGDLPEYGRTYSALPHVFEQRAGLEWSGQTRKKIFERGMTWGEKAVAALSEAAASPELAKAYFTLANCRLAMSVFIADLEKQEEYNRKAVEALCKAVEFAERTGNALVLGLSNCCFGDMIAPDEGRQKAEAALECGDRTRDSRLIAWSLESLTYLTIWKAVAVEDPEQWKELMEEAFQFYDRAHRIYASMPFLLSLGGVMAFPAGYVTYYGQMAEHEPVIEKRLDLLKKAEAAAAEALRLAESSDSPTYIQRVGTYAAKVPWFRAQLDSDLTQKRQRLEKALKFKERASQIRDEGWPFHFWNRGVHRTTLAALEMDLAEVESDTNAKQRLLEDAIASMEQGLKLCGKVVPYYEEKGQLHLYAVLRRDQDRYVALLVRLYDLTKTPEHLRRAIEISRKAIESSGKLDLVSRTAESQWQIAKAQDLLGEHLEAAESFQQASENYRKATEKIPQLKVFYQDYSCYMEAWSEVEKARHAHSKEEHKQATEHYEQAAGLHQATVRWHYLSPNYSAWARLEEAENLSRRDQTEKAREYFQQAARLFAEAKKSITAALDKIEVGDEKAMVTEIVNASDIRREYCLGRTAIETAKILDRQGDHMGSSRNYRAAIGRFQRALEALTDESDRRELRPIVYLSRAWQMMTQAEAEASPGPYLKASQLFAKAKEHSIGEKAKVLALGHSSFCKALEAGTRFEAHRDIAIYRTAKKHLEVAANYYVKAGFKNASEYAKATQRLLDAYMYLDKAETETEPRKKAQYYQISEKLLHASAGSYAKAGYPEKNEEVRRLLESVEEEQQLSRSVVKVLHAPAITSTTTSFSMPSPTHEEPLGLERFEHVDIQAHFTISPDFHIEEEADLRLDLVNVAKNAGLLVRVDKLVPPGFQVTAALSQHTLDDNSVDLKGKRLDPLKVESIKLRLKAIKAGVATVGPTIVYVDDAGKFRTCSLEPVTITVHPRLQFEFKTQAAQTAFAFLTRAFVQDYMQRRLSLENSGWRTLMELVRQGKLSKSSIYGARGRRGPALSELEKRGLVETRIFHGERGRGGKIQKARIAYRKETIKRYIDQQVTKIKEK